MLKKSFFAFVMLFVGLSFIDVNYTSAAAIDEEIEYNKINTELQVKQSEIFEQVLENNNLTLEEFREFGSYHFNGNNEIVIQLKEPKKSDAKQEKLSTLSTQFLTIPNIKIEVVQLSDIELEEVQDGFFDEVEHLNLHELAEVGLNSKNGLTLMIAELSQEQEEAIRSIYSKYGENFIDFDIDPKYAIGGKPFVDLHEDDSMMDPLNLSANVSREYNFNHLGGGIGINTPTSGCTTTGVGFKGNDYFLITAGHCLTGGKGLVTQWSAPIGI